MSTTRLFFGLWVLVILSGCIGNNTPSQQSQTSLIQNNLVQDDTKSSYQGSQAYYNSLFTAEEVNGQTGSLYLNEKLLSLGGITEDIGLNLNLSYSSSAKQASVFGLPVGWSFNISYVSLNDGIATSANINGNNYVIDNKWHDDTDYSSGFRYINNHDISFKLVLPESALTCKLDHRRYRYKFSGYNGSHQYFDGSGRLLAQGNRFGSCISYYYAGYGDVYQSRLVKVVDSYGQEFMLGGYGENIVNIRNNSKVIASFKYANEGVLSVIDAFGYKTSYEYVKYLGSDLLNQIGYPSGLVTKVKYNPLNYNLCSGGVAQLPVVIELSRLSVANKLLNKTEYEYGINSSGDNFTGYSLGLCLGVNTDALENSNNYNFRYDVMIKKYGDTAMPNQISRFYYNFMHLLMEKDDLDITGKVKNRTIYNYDISPDKHIRSASFGQPIQIEQINGGTTTAITNNSYDVYNQPLTSSASILSNGQLVRYKTTDIIYFSQPHYILEQITNKDEVTGSSIKTKNTLSSNQLSIASVEHYVDDAPWKESAYIYDNEGRVTSETLSWLSGQHAGIKSITNHYSYGYTAGRLIIKTTNALGDTSTQLVDTLLPGSPILQNISPTGKITTHSYDTLGRELSTASPMGHTVTSKYLVAQKDGVNSVVKTDAVGYNQIIFYDELGRPIKVSDNGGTDISRVIETDEYSLGGKLVAKTDILGNRSTNSYDEFGRLVQKNDILGNKYLIIYNDTGLLSQSYVNGYLQAADSKDGAGNQIEKNKYSTDGQYTQDKFIYNGFGYQIKKVSTINNKPDTATENIYNGDGKLVVSKQSSYDGAIVTTTKQYDLLDNTLNKRIMVSDKGIIQGNINAYNQVGNLLSTTNPLGQTKTMQYDADGQLTKFIDYDGSAVIYVYDADGNVTCQNNNGTMLIKAYDAMNNPLTITKIDGGNRQTMSYSYARNGLLARVVYPDGKQLNYTYSNADLLSNKTSVFNLKTDYQYDNYGRIVDIVTPQSTISYAYANFLINHKYGMLTGYKVVTSDKEVLSHHYSYDGWNNINQDIINQDMHQITINTARNLRQQVSQQTISSDLPDSYLNMNQVFDYDGQRRLLNSTTNYTDKIGKITTLKEQFDYDKNSNILIYSKNGVKTSYSYNAIDQLVSVDGKNISYDAAGNMLNNLDGAKYSYNKLHELTRVTKHRHITSYNYYPDGMLQTKTTNKNSVSFYYDKGHADGVSSTKNGVTVEDSFLLSVDGAPIASYRDNIASYYLRGGNSTIGFFDSQGTLSNSYNYDAYGMISSKNQIDPAQSFLWDQEYTDPDTGLVFLGTRFYDPKVKRFMSADTYSVDNIYSFGNGDPINNIDPSGHFSVLAGFVLGSEILGAVATTFIAALTFGATTPAALASWASVSATGIAAQTTASITAAASILSVSADVGRIATYEAGNITASNILSYVSMGTATTAVVSAGVGFISNMGSYIGSLSGWLAGAKAGRVAGGIASTGAVNISGLENYVYSDMSIAASGTLGGINGSYAGARAGARSGLWKAWNAGRTMGSHVGYTAGFVATNNLDMVSKLNWEAKCPLYFQTIRGVNMLSGWTANEIDDSQR